MRTKVLLYGILGSALIYTSLKSPFFFTKDWSHIYATRNSDRIKHDDGVNRQIAAETDRPPRGHAKPSTLSDGSDHATYEAVTGDSADEDRSVWDSFYKNKNFIFGKDPISFLKDNIHKIPRGKALVPAMGEGRNAIYLAKKGFTVDGNDLSEVAIDKAMNEARTQKAVIHPIVGDLNTLKFAENQYDFILFSLFYTKEIADKLKKSLKKGGYIMLYLRLEENGPHFRSVSPDDFAVKAEDLKANFKEYKIQSYKEYTDHGTHVVGLLARKP